MRDWNTCAIGRCEVVEDIWSLPMRDWNRVYLNNELVGSEFEAYLWGIETTTFDNLFEMLRHLKPTYEGLKQVAHEV